MYAWKKEVFLRFFFVSFFRVLINFRKSISVISNVLPPRDKIYASVSRSQRSGCKGEEKDFQQFFQLPNFCKLFRLRRTEKNVGHSIFISIRYERCWKQNVIDSAGIIKSDEIMVINGAIVSDLDMMYLESVLQEELALCMMMRSSRTEPPDLSGIMRVTDDIIESLVCPPPPTDPPVISEEMITGLIVPAPGWSEFAFNSHNFQPFY